MKGLLWCDLEGRNLSAGASVDYRAAYIAAMHDYKAALHAADQAARIALGAVYDQEIINANAEDRPAEMFLVGELTA